MQIKTGLPHEKNGGHTLALYGKPRILSGGRVYIDCHIIRATVALGKEDLYLFDTIDRAELTSTTIKRMRSFAKEQVRRHLKGKDSKIRAEKGEYYQNNRWHGFLFHVLK